MKQRMQFKDVEPDGFTAIMRLENYSRKTDINPAYKELIKIRASQINHCAYCIAMHTEEARAMGETEQRIYALSAWRESPLFNAEEQALLAFTEEATLIADGGVSDATYKRIKELFGEKTLAQILLLVITINAWNRLCVATHAIYEKQLEVA
jgi:AhpD family alkylhydroperoxidase